MNRFVFMVGLIENRLAFGYQQNFWKDFIGISFTGWSMLLVFEQSLLVCLQIGKMNMFPSKASWKSVILTNFTGMFQVFFAWYINTEKIPNLEFPHLNPRTKEGCIEIHKMKCFVLERKCQYFATLSFLWYLMTANNLGPFTNFLTSAKFPYIRVS